MATQSPAMPKPPGFFSKITEFFNSVLAWTGMGALLWAGLTYASKNMTLLGPLNWADATIVGALLMTLVMLGFTGSLALWRRFSPAASGYGSRAMTLAGCRGLIQIYHQSAAPTLTFKQTAERDACFMMIRRFLSKEFQHKFDNSTDGIRTDLNDLDDLARRLSRELDKIAARWRLL